MDNLPDKFHSPLAFIHSSSTYMLHHTKLTLYCSESMQVYLTHTDRLIHNHNTCMSVSIESTVGVWDRRGSQVFINTCTVHDCLRCDHIIMINVTLAL